MRQGTTPIYTFTFPFDLSVADDLLVTFKQGSRLISKHKEDGTTEGDTFAFRLTQEETLGFYEGNCKGQIKILNGIDVIGSTLFDVKVKPILEKTPFDIADPGEEGEEEDTTQIITLSHSLSNCEVAIDELNQDIVVTFTEYYQLGSAGSVYWNDIINKPSTFPSSWNELSGKPTTFPTSWDAVTGKPTTFPSNGADVFIDDTDFSILTGENAQELAEDTDSVVNVCNMLAGMAKTAIDSHTTEIISRPSEYTGEAYHIKTAERTAWNGKYTKPSNGIPKSDLAASVQASLDKADSSVQSLEGYATEAFVNSSIATQTANFIGTFNSVAELNAYAGTKTPNDYAFVVVYDSVVPTQVKQYDRYKWSGTAWQFEYTLNNSSFTAAQWSAINSGITNAKRQQYDGYALTKQDAIDDLDDMRNNIATNTESIGALVEAFESGVSELTDNINTKLPMEVVSTTYITATGTTTPIGVKSGSAGSSYIAFATSGGYVGSLGVNSSKQPVFNNGTSTIVLASTSAIPSDSHINDLIDAKIGVIENGSY